ncbi:Rrf2 family transcriptional regulator [Parafannyhessea umbonata]|uniref:Rrf2 family transcriptional regulator n=1 Tax=Parafannyhessea umbonata TaxID=604330 RepID=UPI001E58148C|nr:Rrf2 family transcriptional regulator [Parafannyhessea umbonata]
MQITSKLTMAVHMVCAIDYFGDSQPVTSTFLAKSVGTNPVMIRNIMGDLKRAGIISSSKGKSGISLVRPLGKITLLDLWRAVDQSDADPLFRFHENPCPQCPVGGAISTRRWMGTSPMRSGRWRTSLPASHWRTWRQTFAVARMVTLRLSPEAMRMGLPASHWRTWRQTCAVVRMVTLRLSPEAMWAGKGRGAVPLACC